MNWKDLYVMLHMGTVLTASTVFIFMHPIAEIFVAWCGLVGAIGAVFHWLAREVPGASISPSSDTPT